MSARKPRQRNADGEVGRDGRALVWRQLITTPKRDNATIALACMEEGVDVDVHYVSCIKSRWRNTLKVLRDAGHEVPQA